MDIFTKMEFSVILKMLFAGVCIYIYILAITKIAGKRTFAKMSSFDFAVTIAMGSILADAVNKPGSSLMPAFVSLAILAVLQVVFAKLRSSSDQFENAVSNTPILLMDGERILHENLKKALVSQSDLMGKLREANVLRLSQVQAVVFETTGDISVLHTSDNTVIEPIILEGVKS